MSLPKNTQAYSDVEQVLLSIGTRTTARIKFKTKSAAFTWRRRMYFFRTLLRKLNAEMYSDIPGHPAVTPYDDVILSIEENYIIYSLRMPNCTIEDADGTPIPLIEE